MHRKIIIALCICFIMLSLTGCGSGVAASVAKTTGKVTWTAAKLAGKGLYHAGKAVKKVAIDMPMGRTTVQLYAKNNSYLINAVVNRRMSARFLLDTGCTQTLISARLARQLGIAPNAGRQVMCTVAGGTQVTGQEIILNELKVGRAKVKNVPAVVLTQDQTKGYDGLLGMAFLRYFNFSIDTERHILVLNRK